MRYPKLKIKLLEPAIMALSDDEAILAELNNDNITVKKTISAHDIQEYLMLTDDLELIEASDSVECKRVVRALEIFTEFDISHKTKGAAIEAKLISILDSLVANDMLTFTAEDKVYILAICLDTISWAKQNGHTHCVLDIL